MVGFVCSLTLTALVFPIEGHGRMKIEEECGVPPNRNDASPEALRRFNNKCTHQLMLREGNTVYAVFMLQARKKVEAVSDKAASCAKSSDPNCAATALQDLKSDGTCLNSENSIDDCKERLARLAADAAVQTRDNTLRNNKGRVDLITNKGDLQLCNGDLCSVDGNKPDTTMIKELNDAAKADEDARAARRKPKTLGELLGTTDVSFQPKGQQGDAIRDGADLQNETAQTEDLKKINSDVSQNIDEKENLQDNSGSKAKDLQGALDTAKRNWGTAIGKSQKEAAKEAQQLSRKPATGGDTSMDAFDGAIDAMRDSAKSQSGGGAPANGYDALNKKSQVDVDYSEGGKIETNIVNSLRQPSAAGP